jgi:hypothetical protein
MNLTCFAITRYANVDVITGDPNTQLYTDPDCTIDDGGIGNYNDSILEYNAPGFDGLVTSDGPCTPPP